MGEKGWMTAVFLIFDVVSAQLQGFQPCAFAEISSKKSKIFAAHRYIFYVNALNGSLLRAVGGSHPLFPSADSEDFWDDEIYLHSRSLLPASA
jgi:hypothetical protein